MGNRRTHRSDKWAVDWLVAAMVKLVLFVRHRVPLWTVVDVLRGIVKETRLYPIGLACFEATGIFRTRQPAASGRRAGRDCLLAEDSMKPVQKTPRRAAPSDA